MKSVHNIFIIIIHVLLIGITSSSAQISWTKDPNNPVLSNGPGGSWDEQGVWSPSVLYHNNTYHMWYSTSDFAGIGHATSADGVTWQRDSLNPVLVEGPANSWEDNDVSAPMVIVVNDIFHMWYSGHDVPQNHLGFRIGHATSADGSNWVKDTLNPVLDMGNSGSWDDTWVYSGSVVFDGSNYHLYYNAWDGSFPDTVRSGHATSPVPNGRNWTKDPANPVLVPKLAWERNRLEGTNVMYDGSMFHAWYTAGDFSADAQIGYATSPDGSNWTRFSNNAVLPFGQTGQWDDNSVYWPSVFFDGSEYKMWYSGWDGVTEQIGFATAPITLNVPGDYTTIQEAINAAVDGNLVLVADGTYQENINFKGKAITVASHYYIDGDTSHISNTIINGSSPSDPDSGSVVYFVSGEDKRSVICGFTITGGNGTINLVNNWRNGGGIYATDSSPHIKNNIIESNIITYNNDSYGGGISASVLNNNEFIIENNVIRNNELVSSSVTDYSLGAGIYVGAVDTDTVRIIGNKILNNTISAPVAYGCGITPANGGNANYIIINNIISGNIINAANGASGGIDIFDHFPIVRNNLIINNSAPIGAGIGIEFTNPPKINNAAARGFRYKSWEQRVGFNTSKMEIAHLSNNTVVNNSATDSGGGIAIIGSTTIPELMNFIIWGNNAPNNAQISGNGNVQYSDIEGGYGDSTNIDSDPMFADTLYHLLAGSPCIDAGNSDPAYNDLDGTRNDMGAYGGPIGISGLIKIDNSNKFPQKIYLNQNYPNPFNPVTNIEFSIPKTELVSLKIYNLLGQEVITLVSEKLNAGSYKYSWNASSLASGVYLYKLKAAEFVEIKKMILLK